MCSNAKSTVILPKSDIKNQLYYIPLYWRTVIKGPGLGRLIGIEAFHMGQEGRIAVLQDGLACLPDHIEEVGQVVQGIEAEGQQLLADVQMPQIAREERPAGVGSWQAGSRGLSSSAYSLRLMLTLPSEV